MRKKCEDSCEKGCDEDCYRSILRKAKSGDIKAQCDLGLIYEKKEDYKEAFKWLTKAADKDSAIAQRALGFLYEFGYGTNKDINEAIKWYKKAVALGDSSAMVNLANYYYEKQQYNEAFKLYTTVFDKGDYKGSLARDIGRMY